MGWKPLPLSPLARAQLPALLISTVFTDTDAYTIHLTDLTSIWSESLDRRAIIRRSREENTSIDPSSSGQFEIFRDKLQLGLEGGLGTSCALTVLDSKGAGEEARRSALVLNVTVKLPGGLVPLQWPIRLEAAPQTVMTIELVLPLMRAQHMRVRELEGLQELLRQKDHVIEKLVENFKSDLSEVFPQGGRSGRKGEWKGDKVKGMPKFEYNEWRRSLDGSADLTAAQLIDEVFVSKTATVPSAGKDQDDDLDGDWWESIEGITINLTTGKVGKDKKGKGVIRKQSSPPVKRPPPLKNEESTEDEAFQVQATPKKAASITDATTESDDDFDAPQDHKIPDRVRNSPSPSLPISKPKKKLGAIGGKKAIVKPPPSDDDSTADEAEAASPPPKQEAPRPKKTLGKIGGKKQPPPPPSEPKPEPRETEVETESDSGSDSNKNPIPKPSKQSSQPQSSSDTALPKEPTPSPPPTAATTEPPKPKRKLGQIGGKKKQIAKEATPESEVEPKIEPSSSPVAPKRKLGIIGKKRDSDSPVPGHVEEGERGRVKAERTATPEAPVPPTKRETSEERADVKREKLKRELEAKAKAPVKKKRKF